MGYLVNAVSLNGRVDELLHKLPFQILKISSGLALRTESEGF